MYFYSSDSNNNLENDGKDNEIDNMIRNRRKNRKRSAHSESFIKTSDSPSSEWNDFKITEPEYEPPVTTRLPVIRWSTQINDIMNHDIYNKDGELNSHHLKPSSSMQHITFNRNSSIMSKQSSKFSKHSSMNSHSQSNGTIFKEKYDKNIAEYMQSIEERIKNRKNYSSSIGKLMSPQFSTTMTKKYDL